MSKRTETIEKTIARWYANTLHISHDRLLDAGWEPGQSPCLTLNGVCYERFDIDGGYVVVEWDNSGNVCVS